MRSGETRSPAPRLLRARRERPCGYTAADECDEVPPPHGADPKAKDHGLTIADQGGASQQEAVTSVRCGSIAPQAISASRHHMSALLRKRTSSRHFDLSALCQKQSFRETSFSHSINISGDVFRPTTLGNARYLIAALQMERTNLPARS